MAKVNVTQAEETELRSVLGTADPWVKSTEQIGAPALYPIVDDWSYVDGPLDGPGAVGVNVRTTGRRDEEGDVEMPAEAGHAVLDEPGSLGLGEKILAAGGELPDSNRRHSLRFAFARHGMGK